MFSPFMKQHGLKIQYLFIKIHLLKFEIRMFEIRNASCSLYIDVREYNSLTAGQENNSLTALDPPRIDG